MWWIKIIINYVLNTTKKKGIIDSFFIDGFKNRL